MGPPSRSILSPDAKDESADVIECATSGRRGCGSRKPNRHDSAAAILPYSAVTDVRILRKERDPNRYGRRPWRLAYVLVPERKAGQKETYAPKPIGW